MQVCNILMAGLLANAVALGATADTRVFRGPPCQLGAGGYLLAANSGAIIRVNDMHDSPDQAVIIFRPPTEHGWASQRILSRFDLALGDDEKVTVTNSGRVCGNLAR